MSNILIPFAPHFTTDYQNCWADKQELVVYNGNQLCVLDWCAPTMRAGWSHVAYPHVYGERHRGKAIRRVKRRYLNGGSEIPVQADIQ